MLDLYERETEEALMRTPGARTPEAGVFDGFLRGAGNAAVRTAIKTIARPVAMVGSLGAVAYDRASGIETSIETISNGSSASARYFKSMDEIFDTAIDYWTPKAGEVGVAGEVVGQLLGLLPIVVASPATAVAGTYLDTATELAKKGVADWRAQAVGAAQAVGLGAGIWMPILGQTLAQRVLLGGAGFNVLQGVATRGTSELILGDHPAAKEFKALDGTALTLDVLLGMAFGGITHLSPAQRAQGAAAWGRIRDWANELPPSDKSAIMVLREGQHLNVDSLPGKPVGALDKDAHVQRMRTVLDQVIRGEPPHVEGMPAPKIEPDPARWTEAEKRARVLVAEGAAVAKAYDLVLEHPLGPANEPLVRLTPESIGDVVLERGPAFQKQGSAEIGTGGYGLVKIIWKHGERSGKDKEAQATRDDVIRVPEVVRLYKPVIDRTDPESGRVLQWQVENAEGKKIVYSVREFTGADGQQHVVSIFVNEGKAERFKNLPLSEKRNRLAESPGGSSKDRPGDTDPETSYSSQGGQEDGAKSIPRTEGPPAQRAEPSSPPPPDAGSRAEPAGPEAADPLSLEADRVAAEMPQVQIRVGEKTDGTPETMSAAEYLADARAQVAQAREDAKLFEVAAACMHGQG